MKRMSKWRRAAGTLAVALALTVSAAQPGLAASGPDWNEPVELTVNLDLSGRSISISLYRVGEWDEASESYVATADYALAGLTFDKWTASEIQRNVSALEDYLAGTHVEADATSTTRNGSVSFDNLTGGVYLVRQAGISTGGITMQPYLTTLPVWEEESRQWLYQVSAYPKSDVTVTPTRPSSHGGGGGGDTPSTPTTPTAPAPTAPEVPTTPGSSDSDRPRTIGEILTSEITDGSIPLTVREFLETLIDEDTPLGHLVRTGDGRSFLGFGIFLGSAFGVLVLTVTGRKRRKKEENEAE